jgi:hypothetical protein
MPDWIDDLNADVTEQWKTIEGFENYAVSDLGRVQRVIKDKLNRRLRMIKPQADRAGYIHVPLYKDNKKYHGILHRLVAKAFLPNPEGLPEVNHKGPKSDCRATMLEWKSKAAHRMDQMMREQKGDGVTFKKANRGKKWYATVYPSVGKAVHVGTFFTYEEALAARRAAIAALAEAS